MTIEQKQDSDTKVVSDWKCAKSIEIALIQRGWRNDFARWEVQMMDEWRKEFDFDCIMYACDICYRNLNKFYAKYVDAIITKWRENNLNNFADIRDYERSFGAKNNAKQKKNTFFKDDAHRNRYEKIISKTTHPDSHLRSVAYLLALDEHISQHGDRVVECFDFESDSINLGALNSAWVNETDRRILMLAFNLWDSAYVANIADVFANDEYAEYMWEAIKIRFDMVQIFAKNNTK